MTATPALWSTADVASFVTDYYNAWSGTDEDLILSYYAEDVVLQIPGLLIEGKKALRDQFVRPFITAFPGNRHLVKSMTFGPGVVVVEFSFEAEHTGPFAGHVATGAQVTLPGCGVYEYDSANRQVTAGRIYFDVGTLLHSITNALADDHTTKEALGRAAVEASLRESEYRYRNLFQAMAASFWELDFTQIGAMLRQLRAEGVKDYASYFSDHPEFVRSLMRATRVVDVNDQTVALFGRGDKAELLRPLDDYWPDESNHVFAASVLAALSGKPSYAAECKMRKLSGETFDALFTACFAPETVVAGKLLIGVIDISERVRAQAMLAQIQAEFAHAARVSMLGELTASIAHEVNQPLTAIANNASASLLWLERSEPDIPEVRAVTHRIIADAQRAAEIIARVRAMAGHRSLETMPLAVNGVVEEAMLFLAHELQAHGVTLKLSLVNGAPPVLADRVQLQQVVVNLAVNAIQAMVQTVADQRRLTVRTRFDDGRVQVDVEDTGPGIDPGQQQRLFESFFTTKSNGMGMGLPICRSILESYGGAISVRNLDSGGACFSFTLPAAPERAEGALQS